MYMKSELIHPSLIFTTSVIRFAVETTLFVTHKRMKQHWCIVLSFSLK